MLEIAVCDDETNICNDIEAYIDYYAENSEVTFKTEVYFSAEKLLEAYNSGKRYDLVFLDIEMEGMSGIDYGKILRDEMDDQKTKIVYMSWQKSYAMDLFKIRPFDFLVKPLDAVAIGRTLDTAIKLIGDIDAYYIVQTRNEHIKLLQKDILYFESSNRKVTVHTSERIIEFYGKLEDVSMQLGSDVFWRIHKSYLIHYDHTDHFKYDAVCLEDGTYLPISQSYRSEIRSKLEAITKRRG